MIVGTVAIIGLTLAACGAPSSPSDSATIETPSPQVVASQAALLQLVDRDTNGMITARDQGARFPGGKFVAKETLKVIAHEVRNMNGKSFRKIFNFLDESTTNKLLAHSDEIADAIEGLVNVLDKPQAIMRQRLYNQFVRFLPSSKAEDLASAIAGVVSNALF